MKSASNRHEQALTAVVVAVFAAFSVVVFALEDPPELPSQYLSSAVALAVVATPWVIAARRMWRAWWSPTSDVTTRDVPSPLLASAAKALPSNRRDWGTAMEAELAHLQSVAGRWQFALGCVRTALFPSLNNRAPAVVLVVAVAVVGVGLAVGLALPAIAVFSVTFVVLIGIAMMLAMARSQRLREGLPSPGVIVVGLVGVAGCIALTAYFLLEHPSSIGAFDPIVAVVLAVVLAGSLWLTVSPPKGLTSSRVAQRCGVGAALVLGGSFAVTSRLALETQLDLDAGVAAYLMFAPIVILFFGSAIAAMREGSFRAGVQAAVWTALLGTLLVFVIYFPEVLGWHRLEGRLLLDGETGYPVGVNLRDAIVWILVWLPIWGLPFGVIGASAGAVRGKSPTDPQVASA